MVDFLNRLRARLEAMQAELTPEAGFDRRAYGYDGEGAEDATFGETDREEEEESPWRREADGRTNRRGAGPGNDARKRSRSRPAARRRPGRTAVEKRGPRFRPTPVRPPSGAFSRRFVPR